MEENNNLEENNIQVENTQNNIQAETLQTNSIQNEVTQTENIDNQNSEEVKIQNENIETQNVQADNNQTEVTPDSKSENVNITNQTSNKKSKKIIIVIGIIILIVTILFVLSFILKDRNSNNSNNNKDNNDDLQNNIGENVTSTDSDDGYISSPTDKEVEDKNQKYIYNKNNNFIVFKYKCISENWNCDLKVIDKGIIIYDDDKVRYRDFTTQEYNKINSDKEVESEELSLDGFKEVELLNDKINYDSILEEEGCLPNLYIINNKLYVDRIGLESVDELINQSFAEKMDNFIIFGSTIYDYKNNKEISRLCEESEELYDYGKIGNYYYFLFYDDGYYWKEYILLNKYSEIVQSDIDSLYFDGDKIYYIKNESEGIKILNDKEEIISYKLEGLTPLYIFGDKLIYKDNENMLGVKNLLSDENVNKLNIKIDSYSIPFQYPLNKDSLEIIAEDYSLLDNKEFDDFRKKEGITDDEIKEVKKCIQDEDSCNLYGGYTIGYKIKLNKEGKIVSKNYIVEVYQ